jgi:hypothetical protein
MVDPVMRRLLATATVACCLVVSACGSGADSHANGSHQAEVKGVSATDTSRTAGQTVLSGPPVYPLTGLPAPSRAAASKPSLAVKIDNVSGAWPQAGVNSADIVFDILVEGGLTRLMAVYQSHPASLIGPIRSARPVDADLLRLFNGGYFAFSGASRHEMKPVRNHSHAVLLYADSDSTPFYRRSDHVSPDNLFSSSQALNAALHRMAPDKAGPPRVFGYSHQTPRGIPTRQATVPYPAATAGWTWDGHEYLRSQDGHPDMLIPGDRISTSNVVVMSVKIVGTGIFETNGDEDPLPVTVGSGKCWVLRDAVRVNCTWHRSTTNHRLHLLDSRGQPIALAPGRTWVELMPSTQTPRFHG